MQRFLAHVCLTVTLVVSPSPLRAGESTATELRFEVKVAEKLFGKPQDGRLLIVLGRSGKSEPRFALAPMRMLRRSSASMPRNLNQAARASLMGMR